MDRTTDLLPGAPTGSRLSAHHAAFLRIAPYALGVTTTKLLAGLTLMACLLVPRGNIWDSPDAYLRQTPPSDSPKEFAPGQLADNGAFVMGRVAFSQDGTEFYFTQNDSWKSGDHAELRVVRYADGNWGKPQRLSEQFMSPTLSLDGNTLYMRKGGRRNVWAAKRSGSNWSEPVPLLVGAFGVYDFMPTTSGRFYVGSEPDADDVTHGITYAFSVITIADGKPVVRSLGRPLNEPGFNGDLYVAPDESYIIISAHETKDFESELWISFHKPDLTWTVPVSLGPKINNGLAHRWGQYVTPDGKYLFYSWGTSEKDCGVYWVRFDNLLNRLRAEAL
jgi:hypothetical protein